MLINDDLLTELEGVWNYPSIVDEGYIETYRAVQTLGKNPLLHFVKYGIAEKRVRLAYFWARALAELSGLILAGVGRVFLSGYILVIPWHNMKEY